MLYRILRVDENWHAGLSANNPNYITSVFEHVINKGNNKITELRTSNSEWQSPYITTCGSLNSVLEYRKQFHPLNTHIVQISEDNLPVVKIDLRTLSNRKNYYVRDTNSNELIKDFNIFAKENEVVLLVGYVPATHVQLMEESEFDCGQLYVGMLANLT